MSSHITVTIMLCVLSCEPTEIRVWDGDSLRLGMTQEAEAIRIFNIDDRKSRDSVPMKAIWRSTRSIGSQSCWPVSAWRSCAKGPIAMAARSP